MENFFHSKTELSSPQSAFLNLKKNTCLESKSNMINLSAEIKLYRIFYIITNKLLKANIFSLKSSPKSSKKTFQKQKILIFKQYLKILIDLWFKYVNIYIILVEEKKSSFEKLTEKDNFTLLSCSEDEEETNSEKKSFHINKRLLTYPKIFSDQLNFINDKDQMSFSQFLISFDSSTIKKLNIQGEIEQFVIFLFENLILEAAELKSHGKIKETFIVLCKAIDIAKSLEISSVRK